MLCARLAVLIASVAFLPVPGGADIIVWRDADGGSNYTNSREAVPAAYRASAQVLIADVPRPQSPTTVMPPAPAVPVPSADEAYLAGLRIGMGLAGESGGGGGGGGNASGGSLEINAPLSVTTVHVAEPAAFAPGDGEWSAWQGYYPFVTTSFDRGRSRHQTLRMLLQEQFQLDREGPFAYRRWDQPGVGPALAPFLSRGLPLPVRQYGRVIYR